jgi:hypothetical protein
MWMIDFTYPEGVLEPDALATAVDRLTESLLRHPVSRRYFRWQTVRGVYVAREDLASREWTFGAIERLGERMRRSGRRRRALPGRLRRRPWSVRCSGVCLDGRPVVRPGRSAAYP